MAALALASLAAWATALGTRWPSLYVMTGESMEPTVGAGDYFIAWSPPGRPAPGDLVVFRSRDEDGVFHVLRRVAALPGDTVAMDSGVVVLNGVPEQWPFRILVPAASRSELAIVRGFVAFEDLLARVTRTLGGRRPRRRPSSRSDRLRIRTSGFESSRARFR